MSFKDLSREPRFLLGEIGIADSAETPSRSDIQGFEICFWQVEKAAERAGRQVRGHVNALQGFSETPA